MRRPARLPFGIVALALVVPVGGCGGSVHTSGVRAAASARAAATGSAAPAISAPVTPTPATGRPAPAEPFAVGVRHLALARSADRPLPTTIWYPAGGGTGGDPRTNAPPAPGRFPLILFSHGLSGLPAHLAAVGTRWAAAGFVVAAPAYPHTWRDAPHFDVLDVANQPADASYVISQLLLLDGQVGDPFAGHLDPAAIAAAGHSAGAYTTTGLLSSGRDPRLRAAIVIAGALLSGGYAGPAIPVLFVHGDADETVSYVNGGRTAYDSLPWPKAFLTLLGGDHGSYLGTGNAGFDQVITTTTDFLRWSLYGDAGAKGRLADDGTAPGTSRWESRW